MRTDVVKCRRVRRGAAVFVLSLLAMAVVLGCQGTIGGDVGPPGGHDAATAAVQAYMEANGFKVYYVDSCPLVRDKSYPGNLLYWCHYVNRGCPGGMLSEPCESLEGSFDEFDRLESSCFHIEAQGVVTKMPATACGHG